MEHTNWIHVAVRILVVGGLLVIVIASQIFWIRRLLAWAARFVPSHSRCRWRRWMSWAALLGYLVLLAYNLGGPFAGSSPTRLTLPAAVFGAPFEWWLFGSTLGFLVWLLFAIPDRIVRAIYGCFSRPPRRDLLAGEAASAGEPAPGDLAVTGKKARAARAVETPLRVPARRRFLEQTAVAIGAVPFVAGAYGLLYERLEVETTRRRIELGRLPRAFDGFRLAQLSDIHIGPFMTENEVRNVVEMTDRLRPDLIALTGDFITWDPSTQGAVVRALAGLRAPFGVYGCLGNHEMWTGTQESITQLFALSGIDILRGRLAPIRNRGETLNLIGVDFETRERMGHRGEGFVPNYLQGVENLIGRDTVNVLLSHNPNTFDRAAELGVDLSLAGHTHGGQVTLEFVNRDVSPVRLITPYLRGWFTKRGAQLYVNSGIGTIGVPIRLNVPPEITLFELVRQS